MDHRSMTQQNTVMFRERHDYGPIPAVYYYSDWISERAARYYGGHITYAIQTSLGSYHKGMGRALLGTKRQWERLGRSILNKIIAQPGFVSRTDRQSKAVAKRYRDFSRRLLDKKGEFKSDDELITAHRRWIWFYNEFSFWNCLLWLAGGDPLALALDKLLAAYRVKPEDKQILTAPDRPSYLFREERELLAIATRVDFSEKELKNQSQAARLALAKHADKWAFIPWDYIGPRYLTDRVLLQRILREVGSKKAAVQRLGEKAVFFKNLKQEQRRLCKAYKIGPRDVRLLRDLRILTLMQDEKKEVCTLAQYALHKSIFKYLAKRLKLPSVACIKYSETELWQALSDTAVRRYLHDSLPKRARSTTGITTASGVAIIFGQDSQNFYHSFSTRITDHKEIRGRTATLGACRGRVKVLYSTKQLSKVKSGDILVATMTTPDYLPAMKLAKAIITDEGGLTSHAAIVSRELGIPCIVGTKIATKVLRDNDYVSVDANTGIVKKIKTGG